MTEPILLKILAALFVMTEAVWTNKPTAWFAEDATAVAGALTAEGKTDDGVWSNCGSDQLTVDADRIELDADDATPVTYCPNEMLTADAASVMLTDVTFGAARGALPELQDGAQAAVAITTNANGECVFAVANDGAWEVTDKAADPAAAYAVEVDFTYADVKTVSYSVSNETGWVSLKSDAVNPLTTKKISMVEFAGSGSFSTFVGAYPLSPEGTEGNPWRIGATTNDTVTAWTNGTTLVVEGRGTMKGFGAVAEGSDSTGCAPWGADIAEVDFGAQVTNIGANAFAGCTLTNLTMRGNPPALDGNDLSGATIIVREDAEAKFKVAEGWKDLTYGETLGVCYDYEHIKTLAPFLHEVWFDDYTFDEKGETLSGVEMFSCSAVRNGNFIGRNFDFFLDDKPEFVVHVAASSNRLASVGMAMHTGMREDGVTNRQYTASYDLLPNRMLDGINECGVAINQNVVAYDPEVVAGAGKEFTGTNPDGEGLNISFVTRMVLDRATNAAHAVELIKSRNLFGMSVSGDILHYMISDKDETYVVEIITNTVVARHFKMMTNFALNWDNGNARAVTDADTNDCCWTAGWYPEPTNLVIMAGNFDDATNALARYYALHAEGVERFIRLRDHYDEGATFEGMVSLMRRAQYSQASYFELAQPYWYSDRCSVALDKELVDLGFPALANTYVLYGLKYYPNKTGMVGFSLDNFLGRELMAHERECLENKDAHRKDDCGVWLTVHNTTYDISNRMFRVAVQENYEQTFDIYLADRPTEQPVEPGKVLGPYVTADEATNVAKKAVLAPSEEVSKALETDEARRTYCDMFCFVVDYKEAGVEPGWYVETMLYPEQWTNLVKSAQEATLQLPISDIAAWQSGDDPIPVQLTNCVPGFFYSLYDSSAVTNLKATMIENDLNVLCGTDKKVLFPEVAKPTGGQNSGFFSIGVLEIPGVKSGSDGVPVPPVPHPGPYPYVH